MGKRSSASQRAKLNAILREARLQAGLTQVQVAERLHRPQSYVSKYERGELRLDILELREVCEALGITLTAFARKLDKLLG
jgi:transcriptional regulator with XRE-family HTH domain